MTQRKLQNLKWINLVTLIVVIIINALSNSLPFNDITTGELADRLNVLFTPAGYVFSIWSVIYALLAIWAVRQFISIKDADYAAYERISLAFFINGLLNGGWLVVFHYGYFMLSMVIMTALLINLIMIYYRIDGAHSNVTIWMRLPFSIYMGWISVAFIVNIGVVFNSLGFEDGLWLSAEVWTILGLIIALIIAGYLTTTLKDAVYPFVFTWAFIGIAVERWYEYTFLAYIALISAIILGAIALYMIIKWKGFYHR
ncbi:tryptophan-rich sensory protein [Bacillus sp. A301a_S52]|nr:tryptophan-rich sensory protein [Bacillus sp. A301a_S52]